MNDCMCQNSKSPNIKFCYLRFSPLISKSETVSSLPPDTPLRSCYHIRSISQLDFSTIPGFLASNDFKQLGLKRIVGFTKSTDLTLRNVVYAVCHNNIDGLFSFPLFWFSIPSRQSYFRSEVLSFVKILQCISNFIHSSFLQNIIVQEISIFFASYYIERAFLTNIFSVSEGIYSIIAEANNMSPVVRFFWCPITVDTNMKIFDNHVVLDEKYLKDSSLLNTSPVVSFNQSTVKKLKISFRTFSKGTYLSRDQE